MTFVHPEFLYLMLPALAILFLFLISGEEEQNRYFSQEVLEKLQVSSNTLTMKARNAIFFVMFALLIIALAQPVIEDGKVKVKAKSSDIMIALDISDSMLAQDVYPTRLDAAKKKVLDLLKESPQERIGVMAFAKDAYLVSPLSFDHRAVRFLLKQLSTASITEKGTDFIRLLSSAKGALKENDNRYLLILTDGADKEDFSKEIALAKKEGIRVFILGVGTEQGAPIKLKDGSFIKQGGNIIVSKLNAAIKELALQTGGAYIESVTSSDDIKAMLSEIQAKTQKRELKEEEVMLYIPLFYYPLGLAMFLLIIATSSMSKRQKLMMPHLFVFALLGLHVKSAEAGLLDFQLLDQAKASYERGDFNSSSNLYGKYIQRHPKAQSHYNRANADYKNGNYKAAATGYEQVHTTDENLQFNALHNLGNAYAKQGDPESLKKALEAYEKALKLKDDKETRENLEAVKKALEQQEQQNDKECDNPKEDEDGEKKEDQQKDQSQENKDANDKKDGDQNQEQEEQKDQDSKEQDQKDHNSADQNQTQSQEEQEASEQEKEEEQKSAQQSEDEQKEQEQKDQQMRGAAEEDPNMMSDREAQKWMKLLQDKPVGHLYQLNSEKSSQERDENEKPW
ncbi:MAG: VWA domain-containing protein [Campylobacterota bacterium]|nr:VWA domain-containing protein [Campylobacterota bacterium]